MKIFVLFVLFCSVFSHLGLANEPTNSSDNAVGSEVVRLNTKLQQLEIDLARLEGVNDELAAVRREMSDALMQISNFLAVADRTLDAATVSIEAADTATNASHSYLAWTGTIVAALSLGAAVLTIYLTRRTVENISGEILKQLKKPSRLNGTEDVSIIEKIKNSVYDDLYYDLSSENVSSILQNKDNLAKFNELIERTVEQKLASIRVDDEWGFAPNEDSKDT